MSLSDYGENLLLEYLFSGSVWAALSTADPGENGSGLVEPSGGSYARVEIGTGNWTAASGGVKTNAVVVTFPTPSGAWGTITHVALMDAISGGNLLASCPLPLSQIVTGTSIAPSFPIGEITVTLT